MQIFPVQRGDVLLQDGSCPLTGDWNIGTKKIDASSGKVLIPNDGTPAYSVPNGFVGLSDGKIYFKVGGSLYYISGTLVEAPSGGRKPLGAWLFWGPIGK